MIKIFKELLIFPFLSGLAVILVSITFFVPMLFSGAVDSLNTTGIPVFGYLIIFLYYLVQYFVIIFCNTALVGAALIRLRGGDPTVGDGFRIASSHLLNILGYALIASTVGIILQAISRRGGIIGRIVSSLFGLAWNIATFLVIPVLAVEGVGPIESVKRSTGLLKKAWGEQIVGNLGIGTVFGLIMFAVILVGSGVVVFVAVNSQSVALTLVLGALLLIVLVLIGLVNSTLNGVYTAAVYQYAVEGRTSGFFQETMVRDAFRTEYR
mgnify:CR=1 FL=1